MTDRIARLLAKVTAGTITMGDGGGGGGQVSNVNTVMAALGMGRAGRLGSLILLANYCDDQPARQWAENHLTRWAWITWQRVGDPGAAVKVAQVRRLAEVALGQHIDPALARKTSLKALAQLVGVNHQTFKRKYYRHFQRIRAEIAYHESMAISALEKTLG